MWFVSHHILRDVFCPRYFIARRRHLDAIDTAEEHLNIANKNLHELKAGEILAEDYALHSKRCHRLLVSLVVMICWDEYFQIFVLASK